MDLDKTKQSYRDGWFLSVGASSADPNRNPDLTDLNTFCGGGGGGGGVLLRGNKQGQWYLNLFPQKTS